MYPDKILGLFHLYGLMIGIGILACFGLLFWYGKRKKIEEKFLDFIFYNGIASIAVGFGAAALFQAVYNYIDNPEAGFQFGNGITFIGGLIGGVICFMALYFIFRKKFKTRLTDVVSFLPACILIAHAFGRVGCLFAGCCHGEYLGQDYVVGGIWMQGTNGVWGYYVPIQLYEAIFLFALCALVIFLYLKFNFQHNLSLYLIAYGIFRFVNEYFRADNRGSIGMGISPSQFWSIVMVAAGIGLIFLMNYMLKLRAKEKEKQAEEDAKQADGTLAMATAGESGSNEPVESVQAVEAETVEPKDEEGVEK